MIVQDLHLKVGLLIDIQKVPQGQGNIVTIYQSQRHQPSAWGEDINPSDQVVTLDLGHIVWKHKVTVHGGQLKADQLTHLQKKSQDLVIMHTICQSQRHQHSAWDKDINLKNQVVTLDLGHTVWKHKATVHGGQLKVDQLMRLQKEHQDPVIIATTSRSQKLLVSAWDVNTDHYIQMMTLDLVLIM